MPDGALSSLSRGIFSRLGEIRDQERVEGERTRQQGLDTILKIAEQSEPDSQAFIYREVLPNYMKDTLKGPSRKLWDNLFGRGPTAAESNASKLNELLQGKIVGAGDAARTRQMAKDRGFAGMFTPETDRQARNLSQYYDAPERADALRSKIVMRDPRKERMAEIEARYGAQYEGQMNKLYEQQRLIGERDAERQRVNAENQQNLLRQRQDYKVSEAINKLANAYVVSGKAKSWQEATRMAGTQVVDKNEAEIDKILAQSELAESQSTLAKTEANAYKAGTAITPGTMRAQTVTKDIQKEFENLFKEYTGATTSLQKTDPQYRELVSALQAEVAGLDKTGDLYFDEKSGTVRSNKGGLTSAFKQSLIEGGDKLKLFRQLAEERKKYDAVKAPAFDAITGNPDYAEYYENKDGILMRRSGRPGGTRTYGPGTDQPPTAAPQAPTKREQRRNRQKQPYTGDINYPQSNDWPPISKLPPARMELGPKNKDMKLPNPMLGPTPIPKPVRFAADPGPGGKRLGPDSIVRDRNGNPYRVLQDTGETQNGKEVYIVVPVGRR